MPETFKLPIWITDYNTLPSGTARPVEYSILLDREEIYVGRDISTSYDEAQNLGNIFEDYVGSEGLSHILEDDYLEWESDGYRYFDIAFEGGPVFKRLYFLRSYDRDFNWSGDSCCLSTPINGRIDPRMKILHTDFKAGTGETIDYDIVPEIRISAHSIEATSNPTTVNIDIWANCDYTASTSDSWITIDPTEGHSGYTTFEVDIEGNTSSARTGSITISYYDEYGNLATEVISVSQTKTTIFSMEPYSQTLDAYGQSGEITIVADGPYNISTNRNWLSLSLNSGSSGTTVVTLTPETNTQRLFTRIAIITAGDASATVSQRPAVITVSPSAITVSPKTSVNYVEVESNIPFTASTSSTWLSVTPSTGSTGTTQLEIDVLQENTGSTQRSATISVGYATITVKQPAISISVEPSAITAVSVASSYTVTVTSNVDFGTAENVPWLYASPSTGGTSGVTEMTIYVEANTSTSPRSGVVLFETAAVAVTQNGAPEPPQISVSPSSLSFNSSGGTKTFTVTSNTDYNINTDGDWLTVSAPSGASGVTQFTVTAAGNYTTTARTASITIGTETISVSQPQNSNISSYFWFKSTDGNISISNLSTTACDDKAILEWSLDGSQWTKVYSGSTYQTRYTGRVYLRGRKGNNGSCSYPPSIAIGSTANNNTITIGGNILSLVYSSGYTTVTASTEVARARLRNDSAITDASALVLPQVVGTNGLYEDQLSNFKGLTTAPVLYTAVLKENEYNGLFSGCTNLNYIKCLATDISAPGCTENWVAGVAATGTFVKAKGFNGWTRGVNGIPEGWTVLEE